MDFSTTPIVQLAWIVADHLQNRGVEVVLVGGLAVEIYTENLYLTKDIDMVNTNYIKPSQLHRFMCELGFRKQGRVYINDTTDISVEFPSGPLAVGRELIKNTTHVHIIDGEIPILFALDVVKDRIAALIHWQDKQSLIQAVSIMLKHGITPSISKNFVSRKVEHQALNYWIYSMDVSNSLKLKICFSLKLYWRKYYSEKSDSE